MSPRAALVSLLLISSALAQDAPRSDQEVHGELVVDHGWGFMLAAPAPGWRALGEVAARRVSPESVAALLKDDVGVPITVSIKPRTVAARARAQAITEGIALQSKQVVKLEEGEVSGKPAVLFELAGRSGGNRVRMTGAVLEHRDHLYHLLMVAQGDGPIPPNALWGQWDAFQLLEGEGPLPGRAPVGVTPPDARGVGWRVNGGKFESAFLGVVIEPRRLSGLRLSAAAVARALIPDAEVALLDDAAGVGLALVPFPPVDAAGAAEWEQGVRAQLLPGREVDPAAGKEYAFLGGERVRLVDLPVGGPDAMVFHHGVAVIDSVARFQVWGWSRSATPEQIERVLTAGCAAIEVLEEGARAELEKQLVRGPDPLGRVGIDWSYRNDVYRHFAHDLTWTRPAAWRVSLDEQILAATAHGALFAVEAPRLGLRGWVSFQRQAGYDAETLHATVLQMMTGGRGAPRSTDTGTSKGGTPLTFSELDVDLPGIPRARALLATSCVGDRLVQAVVVGTAGSLAQAGDAARGLAEGLTLLEEDLVAEGPIEGGWRDLRLGFELHAPGPGWKVGLNKRPGSVLPHSVRELLVEDAAGHQVLLMVVGGVEEGIDSASYEDYLRKSTLASIGGQLRVEVSDTIEQVTLDGVPARHLRGKLAGRGRLDLFLLWRSTVHVVLSVVDPKGDGPPLKDLKACLRLLP